VFPESVHEVIVSVELYAYIAPPYCTNGSTARAAQTKRITPTTNQHSQEALVRPAANGSAQEKVVLQTTPTSTYPTLMPEKSAIESMMP
jgi:hypothetical protein